MSAPLFVTFLALMVLKWVAVLYMRSEFRCVGMLELNQRRVGDYGLPTYIRRMRFCRSWIVPGLFVLLAACGPTEMHLRVIAEADANQNTATALDVVCLYDSASVGMLPKTAPDWFQKKSQLRASLATTMDVLSLELPPATASEVQLPARCGKPLFIYAYANYLASGGQAMFHLKPSKNVEIHLRADTVFVVSP